MKDSDQEILKRTDFELLDIQDQAETVGKLTPREYAKLRDTSPQLIYYHIRNKTIEVEVCICGRRVIDVRAADEALQKKKEARRGNLDTRSDEVRASD